VVLLSCFQKTQKVYEQLIGLATISHVNLCYKLDKILLLSIFQECLF